MIAARFEEFLGQAVMPPVASHSTVPTPVAPATSPSNPSTGPSTSPPLTSSPPASQPPSPSKRKPRSAAQAQASRRNGSKSRGPTSPDGKARSRGNALRHGLTARRDVLELSPLGVLARRIIPPANHRLFEDRDYLRMRQGLIQEFSPSTQTQRNWVDWLADDYLQLARVKQCQTGTFDLGLNNAFPPPSGYALDYVDEVAAIDDALARLARGQRLGRGPQMAAHLAALLAYT